MDAHIDYSGLIRTRQRLTTLEVAMATRTQALLHVRATLIETTFAKDTPVDTGAAAAGWHQEQIDPFTIAVVNEVTSPRGFNYPSALVTGTGQRGVPTTGFTGVFALRAGMAPAAQLHADWEWATHTPFITGVFLPGSW